MRSPLQGEHRRAVILGSVGAAAIVALLVFRTLTGGGADSFAPVDAVPVAPAAVTVPPSVPTTTPVDPALLRDPFCPLVAEAAAPDAPPVTCRRRPPEAGRRLVGLEDVFIEGGVPLARAHVGSVTFPNLHEGDTFGDSFEVVSLSDRCGEFAFGEERFALCEGEETFK